MEQKEAALADTEHQIAREVIKAYADATSSLKNLDASAILDVRHERIRCLAEWRSARLRLLASSGQMGRAAAGD